MFTLASVIVNEAWLFLSALLGPEFVRGSSFYLVGMQGIEPCLLAPKASVLPVYDIPCKNRLAQRAPSEPL